jgi:hypothetical protein
MTLTSIAIVSLMVLASLVPAQSAITFGRWRDINPTQYAAAVDATLNGIYVRNGGSGSIGAGDGWAVGGSGTSGPPVIAHYDGFSWHLMPSGSATTVWYSTHFCTAPGAQVWAFVVQMVMGQMAGLLELIQQEVLQLSRFTGTVRP